MRWSSSTPASTEGSSLPSRHVGGLTGLFQPFQVGHPGAVRITALYRHVDRADEGRSWDEVYAREIETFNEIADEGEVWYLPFSLKP